MAVEVGGSVAGATASASSPSSTRSSTPSAPRMVLLGPLGAGKSQLCAALAGLGPDGVFQVGDSTDPITTKTTCHSAQWFGSDEEEEFMAIDTPGVGEGDGRDPANIARVACKLRELGYINAFVIVFNAEQPRLSSSLQNLLLLLEELFGPDFWRCVALAFTRWYTDARSEARRKKTKAEVRQEWSARLLDQFPAAAAGRQQRTLPAYFFDTEAAIDSRLDVGERQNACLELQRLSMFVRAMPAFKTSKDEPPRSKERVSAPRLGDGMTFDAFRSMNIQSFAVIPELWARAGATKVMVATSQAVSIVRGPFSDFALASPDGCASTSPRGRKFRVVAIAGAAGGLSGGAFGTTAGGVTGCALGLAAAPFTLGLSVPVGVTVGGLMGLCGGVAVGTCAGAAGGFFYHKELDEHGRFLQGRLRGIAAAVARAWRRCAGEGQETDEKDSAKTKKVLKLHNVPVSAGGA